MTEWWFVAVPVALLSGSGVWIWLDEHGVPESVAVPLGAVLGLVSGALVLAAGGAT